MQTIEIEDIPGHTMTFGVEAGYLVARVHDSESVQVCSAQWQCGEAT